MGMLGRGSWLTHPVCLGIQGSDPAVMEGPGHDPGTLPDIFADHQFSSGRCPLQEAGQGSFRFPRQKPNSCPLKKERECTGSFLGKQFQESVTALTKRIHLFIYLNLFFFLEREHELGRGAEKEGDRESQAGSTVSTEPNVGLELTSREIMT